MSVNQTNPLQYYNLDTLVAAGIDFLSKGLDHPPGLGIYSIVIHADEHRPTQDPYDLNRVSIYMSTGPDDDVFFALNQIDDQINHWGGPVLFRGTKVDVKYWRWNERGLVSVQHAMDLLARFGQSGPWRQVALSWPTAVPGLSRPPTEPYYCFQGQSVSGPLFLVGMATGRVLPIPDGSKISEF